MSIPPELMAETKLRILVVDDESQNRKLLSRVIRKNYPEAEIEEAADGFEAGHKVNAFLPTLVVLDRQLPGVDGLKVCKMIRSDQRLQKIKILIISGYNAEEVREEALKSGADDFLAKPFSVEELSTSIERLLK